MRPRIDLLLAAAVAMASLTLQARAVDASDTQPGANGDVISGRWVNPQSPGSHVRVRQNGNEFSAAGGAEVDTGPYRGMPYDATATGRINGNSLTMIFTAILRNGITVVGRCSGVVPADGVVAWKCRDKAGHVSNSTWVRDPASAPSPPAVAATAPVAVSPPRVVAPAAAPAPVVALAPVANPAPAAAAVPAAPIESGRRVALVIGNSAYRAVGLLPNPANDAELVGAALRRAGIEVTIDHDLDREGMIAALRAFTRKANAADWAVIYYAGHGLEVGGTNYLIPVDAKLETDLDVSDEAISLERMMAAIQGARRLKLVVLDACRNNPFARQMKVTVANRSIGRGLAPAEPTGATLVAYAAKEGTTAQDGDSGDSPFALSFAKRVVEPGVEINIVFRYVRKDVLESTNNEQEPFVYGSLPPDNFYFVAPK
jgi:caspase domain-containing protein